jgi:hypothetical protein
MPDSSLVMPPLQSDLSPSPTLAKILSLIFMSAPSTLKSLIARYMTSPLVLFLIPLRTSQPTNRITLPAVKSFVQIE